MIKKTGPNISGEKKIETILNELNLKFKKDKKLILSKDAKKFRMPDFYIEKYNLAIEYFGSWENTKNKAMEKRERARFMEKVGAYKESGIECIYLYPKDLVNAKSKIQKKIDTLNAHLKANEIASSINKKNNSTTTIKTVTTEVTHIKPNKQVDEPKEIIISNSHPKIHSNKSELFDNLLLRKIILILGLLSVVSFIFQFIIYLILFLMGNPFSSELYYASDLFFLIFIICVPLSVILAGIYAFKNNLSQGFIYVSLILLTFFLATIWFFGDPLTRIIVLLIGILAIVPSEYYMISNSK